MLSDRGDLEGAVLGSGSTVAGNWVIAYQTATDDMFIDAQAKNFTTGSVAIQDASIGASNDKVVGISMNDAASGESTAVATEGIFIGLSAGGVTAGEKIMALGQGVIDYNDIASGAAFTIGRAFTGASAADKYVLFKLNL